VFDFWISRGAPLPPFPCYNSFRCNPSPCASKFAIRPLTILVSGALNGSKVWMRQSAW
jgi:hypothetical protein